MRVPRTKKTLRAISITLIATLTIGTPPLRSNETITIHGYVREFMTEEGLGGVHVIALDIKQKEELTTTITDDRGQYQLDGLPVGKTIKLHFFKPGFVDNPEILEFKLGAKSKPPLVELIEQPMLARQDELLNILRKRNNWHNDLAWLQERGLAIEQANILQAALESPHHLRAKHLQKPHNTWQEPKKRIAITDFDNYSGYHDESSDLSDAITAKLIEALDATGKFVIVDEQNMAGDSRATSAQLLIRGIIFDVEDYRKESGGFRIRGIGVGKKGSTVRINIRTIEPDTGQIIASNSIVGGSRKKSLRVRRGELGTGAAINYGVNEAMDDAVKKAVDRVIEYSNNIPWQGTIARVSGSNIIVAAGYQEGIQPGMLLRVFERDWTMLDPDTNEALGRLDEEIGIVRIERVEEGYSIAAIVEGQGIATGNIVKSEEHEVDSPR